MRQACAMNAHAIPNRLKEWRKHRSITQERLAEAVGTSHSTIQRIENGKIRLSDYWAMRLASALRCEPSELFAGNVQPTSAPIRAVPQISWVQATALSPEANPLEKGDYEDIVYYASKRENLIALRVKGDSMDRVAPDGSLIIVDTDDLDILDGKYYIFRCGGDATFKRWRKTPPRLEPCSTNPQHDPLFVSGGCQVIGRVTDVIVRLA